MSGPSVSLASQQQSGETNDPPHTDTPSLAGQQPAAPIKGSTGEGHHRPTHRRSQLPGYAKVRNLELAAAIEQQVA